MNKIIPWFKRYYYLVIGMALWPLTPVLFEQAKNYLPIAELLVVFGAIEVLWDLTFAVTLVSFGLANWIRSVLRDGFDLYIQAFPSRLVRLLVFGGYVAALVGLYFVANQTEHYWTFWLVWSVPFVLLAYNLWDQLKSSAVLLAKVRAARDQARSNKQGQFWFYLNRLVALVQPNAVLAVLVWDRLQHGINSPGEWFGTLIVFVYVLWDNYSTWSFFKAFRLLISTGQKEKKVVYKVFQARYYFDWGFKSLRDLSDQLIAMDKAIWPPNQQAADGSIYQRLVTSPATTFVLVRQDGDKWVVVGAMFTRAIVSENHFPPGQTRFRVAWSSMERDGNFTPEPGANALYGVGIMVLPDEGRGCGAMLEAALGEYAAANGLRFVLGGSRLTGAANAFYLKGFGSRTDFLVDYVWQTDTDGWPVDLTLGKLIRGGSIVVAGRKIAQLLQVQGVILDYFDDRESLDAAALIVYKNPLWWLPGPLRTVWGKILRIMLML